MAFGSDAVAFGISELFIFDGTAGVEKSASKPKVLSPVLDEKSMFRY